MLLSLEIVVGDMDRVPAVDPCIPHTISASRTTLASRKPHAGQHDISLSSYFGICYVLRDSYIASLHSMVQTRQRVGKSANGHANGNAPEISMNGFPRGPDDDEKTDYSRWRLRDEQGRHTWHYLTSEEEIKAWPQTVADKFHLGLPTVSLVRVPRDVS